MANGSHTPSTATGPAIVFPAWWISHVEKDWEHGPFQEFFGALAQHHLVVRYDRVGVGLSDRDRDPERHHG